MRTVNPYFSQYFVFFLQRLALAQDQSVAAEMKIEQGLIIICKAAHFYIALSSLQLENN